MTTPSNRRTVLLLALLVVLLLCVVACLGAALLGALAPVDVNGQIDWSAIFGPLRGE